MKKVDLAVLGTALVAVFADEAPFIAFIVGLVLKFGLWGGFLAFVFLEGVGGLALALVYERVSGYLSTRFGERPPKPHKRLLQQLIARFAEIARPLAALANTVFMGPIFGIPGFRLLGYTGLRLYVWVLASAPIFGAVWVLGVYGRVASILLGGGK